MKQLTYQPRPLTKEVRNVLANDTRNALLMAFQLGLIDVDQVGRGCAAVATLEQLFAIVLRGIEIEDAPPQ